MTHGDAIVDSNGVELFGDTASSLDLTSNQLAHVFEVHVARDELSKRVHNRDDWLTKVAIAHARCAPECTGTCHIAAMG